MINILNKLQILKIRHHLLWEFFIYWTSAWGILISGTAIFVLMALKDIDTEFAILLVLLVILPALYWYWRFKMKAYILLSKYMGKWEKKKVRDV